VNKFFYFSLDLSFEKTESIYQGQIKHIIVLTDEGLKLKLPVQNFRPFVSLNGIQGQFRLETDIKNRLQKIEKIT
jgi:hypothetical protein